MIAIPKKAMPSTLVKTKSVPEKIKVKYEIKSAFLRKFSKEKIISQSRAMAIFSLSVNLGNQAKEKEEKTKSIKIAERYLLKKLLARA